MIPSKPVQEAKGWTKYSAGALEAGISVVVGLAIGAYLDQQFHTEPWQMIFWLICGSAAGGRALYRLAKRIEADEASEAAKPKDGDDDREGPKE